MRSRVAHILLAALLPAAALAQGVPTNDSGLTARDIVETGDRDADLAVQREKLTVEELLTEIEREQLATLRAILDAQTSFGGQGLPGMVADLESGSGASDRSAAAVYGSGDVDPNPGGAGMFGDAAENIEQLIIRVAQETHGRPGVGRAGLSVVQWRALLQALIWQESRFSIGARSPVGAFGLTQIMPGTASDLGINPEYYDSPYLQVEGGARYRERITDEARAREITREVDRIMEGRDARTPVADAVTDEFRARYPDMPSHLARGLGATYASVTDLRDTEALNQVRRDNELREVALGP